MNRLDLLDMALPFLKRIILTEFPKFLFSKKKFSTPAHAQYSLSKLIGIMCLWLLLLKVDRTSNKVKELLRNTMGCLTVSVQTVNRIQFQARITIYLSRLVREKLSKRQLQSGFDRILFQLCGILWAEDIKNTAYERWPPYIVHCTLNIVHCTLYVILMHSMKYQSTKEPQEMWKLFVFKISASVTELHNPRRGPTFATLNSPI